MNILSKLTIKGIDTILKDFHKAISALERLEAHLIETAKADEYKSLQLRNRSNDANAEAKRARDIQEKLRKLVG